MIVMRQFFTVILIWINGAWAIFAFQLSDMTRHFSNIPYSKMCSFQRSCFSLDVDQKQKKKKRIHNNRKMHPNDTQFIIINRNPIHENRNMNDMPCQHAGWSLLIVSQIFSFIDSSNNAFLVGVVIVGRVVCTRTFIPMPFVEFSHRQCNH